MKRFLLAIALFVGLSTSALAQCNGVFPGNTVCGTPPGPTALPGAVSASVFTNTAGGTNGQIQYNNNTALGGFTASQDCTVNTTTGVFTCTKTNGVSYGPFATATDVHELIANFNGGTGANANTYWNGTGAWSSPVVEQKNTASVGLTTSGNCDNTTTNAGSPCNYAMKWDSQVLQAAPSNPTATTSATPVMMGMGVTCHLTPSYSTRIEITFIGTVRNNTAGVNSSMGVRVGTGSAPANGAAAIGTSLVSGITSGGDIGSAQAPSFSLTAIATGLSAGTAYWFDMTLAAGSNTSIITNVNCSIREI